MIEPDYERDGVQLYCGDSLKIMPLLPAASIDCVVTDPPYGHNNNNGDLISQWEAALGKGPAKEARPIANDGVEADDLFKRSLPMMDRLFKKGGCCCCCCCGGGGPDPQFARWSLWLDEVFDFKQMVVWDKGPIGMGWHYRRSYETVLVAQKRGGPCKWYDTTQLIENIIRPGYKGIRKIIPAAHQHPTAKPLELAKHFISLHTEERDVVLDPFGGAGWVAEACVELNRRCISIELDREWHDAAVERVSRAQRKPTLFPRVRKRRERITLF